MIKEDVKLGIFNWFGYIMPAIERVRMIKKAGFDSIMLWWDEELFSKEGEKDLLKIKEMDIVIENLHVPYEECNLIWSEDIQKRDYIVSKYIRWLNECEKYGIQIMVMHLTKGYDVEEPNHYGVEAIKLIIEEAEKCNVRVAVENTRLDEFLDVVLDNISSEWLGVCYDSSHANLYSKNIEYILDKYGDRVIALHLSDNDGYTDRHWLPYKGLIDWNMVMNKLNEINYSGYLSFEVFPEKDKDYCDPDEFLERAYNRAVDLRTILIQP